MRDRRFSTVPIVATILKVVALILALFALYVLIQGLMEAVQSWRGGAGQFGAVPPVAGFGQRLETLLPPLYNFIQSIFLAALAWGFAELFNMVRAIALWRTPEALPEKEA